MRCLARACARWFTYRCNACYQNCRFVWFQRMPRAPDESSLMVMMDGGCAGVKGDAEAGGGVVPGPSRSSARGT